MLSNFVYIVYAISHPSKSHPIALSLFLTISKDFLYSFLSPIPSVLILFSSLISGGRRMDPFAESHVRRESF